MLAPIAGIPHHAGADFAFRENSSTLGIARNETRYVEPADEPGKPPATVKIHVPVDVAVLAYHEERIPMKGAPLLPSEVVTDFGRTCQGYGCSTIRGDLHAVDTAQEYLAKLHGPPIVYEPWVPTQEKITAMFTRVRELMAEGRVELPNDPRLLGQLKLVLGRKMPGGKFSIILPRQGRAHCDLVVAVIHALAQAADAQGSGFTYEPAYDRHLQISNRASQAHDAAGLGESTSGGVFGGNRNVYDW